MLYMEHVPFITGIQDYEKALGITLLFSTIYLLLFSKFHQLSAKTRRYKEERQPCISLRKLLTAGYGVKQFNCMALFRYQERLSAKKEGYGIEGAYSFKNETAMPIYRH